MSTIRVRATGPCPVAVLNPPITATRITARATQTGEARKAISSRGGKIRKRVAVRGWKKTPAVTTISRTIRPRVSAGLAGAESRNRCDLAISSRTGVTISRPRISMAE